MKPKLNRAQAVEDVLAERERQKSVEGFTELRDDEQERGQLRDAAVCIALGVYASLEFAWPFLDRSFERKSYRRDLVRATAVLIAEIERLDRATARGREAAKAHGR